MSAGPLSRLLLPGFEATLSTTNGTLELSLRGNGDMTVSTALGTYLKEVDAQCRRECVQTLDVKLVDLYFLNSSCFHVIAAWVLSIAGRPPEARYTVRFEIHAAQGWQKRGFEAIQRVAPKVAFIA